MEQGDLRRRGDSGNSTANKVLSLIINLLSTYCSFNLRTYIDTRDDLTSPSVRR